MSLFSKKSLSIASVLLLSYATQAETLSSIRPIGFIVSSIAHGVTENDVLIPATASPHDYSLKPSDIAKLKSAELVVWVGEHVDGFLAGTLAHYPKERLLTLSTLPAFRNDPHLLIDEGQHSHHHHDDDHHHHDHSSHTHNEAINWHIWLSPKIGGLIAEAVAEKLTVLYPKQKQKIAENLMAFQQGLKEKNHAIAQQLAPVKDKGFYVFHDAYSYFNRAYDLKELGYFTLNPIIATGVKTLAHIRQEIAEHKVQCLFAEPQFTPKVIQTLQKEAHVRVGVLDPLGADIPLGKGSYTQFLQQLANGYTHCLS